MGILNIVFGHGKDLSALQMSSRGVVIFVIALLLIRISGRRSFGLRMPLDNIISILLGAILSRAVVGASPFVPTVICCLVIVGIHRLVGWLIVLDKRFAQLIEGTSILLFKDNEFIFRHLRRGLVAEEDVLQGLRKSALTDDLRKVERIYLERNGEISPVMKDK